MAFKYNLFKSLAAFPTLVPPWTNIAEKVLYWAHVLFILVGGGHPPISMKSTCAQCKAISAMFFQGGSRVKALPLANPNPLSCL